MSESLPTPITSPDQLTENKQSKLVQSYLGGTLPSTLAERYGFTPSQVRGFLESEHGTALRRALDTDVRDQGEKMYFQFALVAGTVGERIAQRALNDNDPKCWEAQQFVAKTLLPDRKQHSGEVNHHISITANVAASFETAVGALVQIAEERATNPSNSDFSQHLLTGTEGLSHDLDAEVTTLSESVGPNGSGTTTEATAPTVESEPDDPPPA